MRTLLVQPNAASLGFEDATLPEPLALETVATHWPDQEVEILDLRIPGENLTRALQRFKPERVGVTALTTEVYAAKDVLQQAKQWDPSCRTVVGGHHAGLCPEDFSEPFIDMVWTGPFPISSARRDLTERYRDHYCFYGGRISTIQTMQGCPYQCNFCSVHTFHHGKVKYKSPIAVVDEIRTIDDFNIGIVDDAFLSNPHRDKVLAGLLQHEDPHRYWIQARADTIVRNRALVEEWVKVGLHAVLIGLEGTTAMLQLVGKKLTAEQNDEAVHILQDLGVVIWAAFIVDPMWGHTEFDDLKEYVYQRELGPGQFTVMTPLPGTELHKQSQHKLLTHDYRSYDCMHAVVPTFLPREQFYERFADVHRQRMNDTMMDLVRNNRISIEAMRRAGKSNKALTNPESYWPGDPVLGKREGVAV